MTELMNIPILRGQRDKKKKKKPVKEFKKSSEERRNPRIVTPLIKEESVSKSRK